MFTERPVHARTSKSCYARSRGRRPKQRSVQIHATLPTTQVREAGNTGKPPFKNKTPKMVAHSVKRSATRRSRQAHSLQGSHPSGHQSFTAWFLLGKEALLEELD